MSQGTPLSVCPDCGMERSDDDETCAAEYPEAAHLTCLKPPGHDDDHVTCLGYHPEWEDANGLLHRGEYEWAEWADSPSLSRSDTEEER